MKLISKLFPGSKKNEKLTLRAGEPSVYAIANENKEVNEAIEKARLTLHYFISCLKIPKEGQSYFAAKVQIQDGQHIEHIWLIEPEFDSEGNLYGVVGNNPLNLQNVVVDQKIGIAEGAITDWMIIEYGRLIGAYTFRALRNMIVDPADLEKHDRSSFGNTLIDDGEDYFIPNFETPEGAIVSIENAFNECDIEKAISCKDFSIEAELMLRERKMLHVNGGLHNTEMIQFLAERLMADFTKHFQENGFPSFVNVKRAFPKREKISDLHWLISEVIYFPNNTKFLQKINTYLTEDGWRVMYPE